MIRKRYLPGGETRQIWHDALADRARSRGVIPQRASRVEVIPDGQQRGRFSVDFSLLADATGDDSYRVCLVQTFDRYSDAVAAEVAWLERNWVLANA